jgi:predicted transcriptional regulator
MPVDCQGVCRCLFDIGPREFSLYKMLLSAPMRADELAEKLHRDRSTVQRALNKLLRCGMVVRRRHVIRRGGGHFYIYASVPPDKLVPFLKECIQKWHDDMLGSLEMFSTLT